MADELYQYLNFDQIQSFQDAASAAIIPAVNIVEVKTGT
jgi:hypothetical protein